MSPLIFTARVITGSGRGKGLGTPTFNLDLAEVPTVLKEGIYACFAVFSHATGSTYRSDPGKGAALRLPAVMHYGPRPVFKDTPSCEVHLLEALPENTPATLTVEVVAFLRPVADFASPADLQTQIALDIAAAKSILGN